MTTMVLQPSQYNTYINSVSNTTNYGASTTLNLGKYTTTHINRGLIHFNLSSASVVNISSAVMSLYITTNSGNTSGTNLSVYRLKKAFGETNTTWNARFSGVSWSTAGAFGVSDCEQTSIGTVSVPSTTGSGVWIDISLDALKMQEYLVGYLQFGLLLKTDEGSYSYFNVASNNHATTTIRPKLTLTYTQFSPQPVLQSYAVSTYTSGFSETVTLPSVENGFYVVGVGSQPDPISASGVTLSGNPLTFIDSIDSIRGNMSVFYFKSPPSGSHTLAISPTTSNTAVVIEKYMFSNVNQDNPFGTVYKATGTNSYRVPVITNMTSTEGDFLIDFVSGGVSDRNLPTAGYVSSVSSSLYYSFNYRMYQTQSAGGVVDSSYDIQQRSTYRISASLTQPVAWTGVDDFVYTKVGFPIHGADEAPYGTYDQYTKALLHFDGSEGSYTFRDELQNIWTPYRYPSTSGSGAYISTAQKKFGTGSGYFSGSVAGDWAQTDTDFNFRGNDFTIDGWFYYSDLNPVDYNKCLFGEAPNGNNNDFNGLKLTCISASGTDFYLSYVRRASGSSIYGYIGSEIVPVTPGAWNHIAFVRQANDWNAYFNGVSYLHFTSAYSLPDPTLTNEFFKIGQVGTGGWHFGYVDEFRISVGIARWTSNFTPPEYPYAPISGVLGQPFMYSSYPWM